jgi:hypothetical protein
VAAAERVGAAAAAVCVDAKHGFSWASDLFSLVWHKRTLKRNKIESMSLPTFKQEMDRNGFRGRPGHWCPGNDSLRYAPIPLAAHLSHGDPPPHLILRRWQNSQATATVGI